VLWCAFACERWRCGLEGADLGAVCRRCSTGGFCELRKARLLALIVGVDVLQVVGIWDIGGSCLHCRQCHAWHCPLWVPPAALLSGYSLLVHATSTAMAYGRLTAINVVACVGCSLMHSSVELLHLCVSALYIQQPQCCAIGDVV
jgi:hypothetical protein